MIKTFRNEYDFLSNMYPCNILWQGMVYPSLENAYQAMKCLNEKERIYFVNVKPGEAKKLGKSVLMRPDFDDIKYNLMRDLLDVKFQGPLLQRLLETSPESIVEGNWWHDNYWGVCQCSKCKNKIQMNKLGELLQRKRNLSMQHSDIFTMYEGSIYNRNDQAMVEEPAILYDAEGYVMLKIGSYSMCRDVLTVMIEKMPKDLTTQLQIYKFNDTTYMDRATACEKMNMVLNCTGSLSQVLQLD